MIFKKTYTFFEIFILVIALFSTAYFISYLFKNVSAEEITDSDGDGFSDDIDNCPSVSNPSQTDSNHNGIGDACETAVLSKEETQQLADYCGMSLSDLADTQKQLQCGEKISGDLDNSINSHEDNQQLLGILSLLIDNLPGMPELPIPPSSLLNNFLDKTGGVKVCTQTKDGAICQQMLGNVCSSLCEGECLDGSLDEINDPRCELGFCYDPEYGTCAPQSSRQQCESLGGQWSKSEPQECSLGCCSVPENHMFISQKECELFAESHNLDTSQWSFDPSLDEISCNSLSYDTSSEGACVYDLDPSSDLFDSSNPDKKGCKRTTQSECEEMLGEFHQGFLCSNPDLNTVCQKQDHADCVEGKDEIYWFDSCGNQENVYEAGSQQALDRSYNNGKIQPPSEACSLGTASDPLSNQGTCGNCNRFMSSICAPKSESEKGEHLDDTNQDVVCMDLGCTDASGKRRENGETWCAYQTKVGLPGPEQNSFSVELASQIFQRVPIPGLKNLLDPFYGLDLPGSSHFLMTCQNGKIIKSACQVGRAEICEEKRTDANGKEISQASCVANPWERCLAYNPGPQESKLMGHLGPKVQKLMELKLQATCGADPYCYVQRVDITKGGSDTFKFSYCVPRFPPGFDRDKEEDNKGICSQASSTCTEVWVKKANTFGMIGGAVLGATLGGFMGGGVGAGLGGAAGAQWVCEANCECSSKQFIQQMNTFCVSLGDCGLSLNYVGDLPGGFGYMVFKGDLNKLKGKLISQLPLSLQTFSSITIPAGIGAANPNPNEYIPTLEDQKVYSLIKNSTNNLLGANSQTPTTLDSLLAKIFKGGHYRNPADNIGVNYDLSNTISATTGAIAGGYMVTNFLTGSILKGAASGTSPQIPALQDLLHSAENELPAANPAANSLPSGTTSQISAVFSQIAPYMNALAGFSLGFSLTSMVLQWTGIGRGLDNFAGYSIMVAGGAGGAMIFLASFSHISALGPPGWAMMAAVAFVIVIFKLAGIGDIKKKPYSFKCQTWKPPLISSEDKCSSCGKDKLSDGSETFPCNKYACEALGRDCHFVEESEGPEGPNSNICEYIPNNDAQAPTINSFLSEFEGTPLLPEDYEVTQSNSNEYSIQRTDGKCINQYERIPISFSLDEYAQKCAVTAAWHPGITFDEMSSIDGGKGLISFTVSSSDLSSLGYSNDLPSEGNTDITLAVACEDESGNNNLDNPYLFHLCFTSLDQTAPLIGETHKVSLPSEQTTFSYPLTIFEPAECRWANSDVSFDEMPEENSCIGEENILGTWTCNLENLPAEENICVKCRDHPEWQGTADESRRNTNTQCTQISSEVCPPLTITSLTPDGDTFTSPSSHFPVPISFSVEGGCGDEVSCLWQLDDFTSMPFEDSSFSAEIPSSTPLYAGTHSISINCHDQAGNTASAQANFNINIDDTPPLITRFFVKDNNLVILTNEQSQCAFSEESCNFNLSQATSFTSSAGIEHSTTFEPEKTYYIKCRDHPDWDESNQPDSCSIIISGGMI